MWRFQTLCFVNPPFYLLFLDLKDAMYVFCFIGTLEIPVHFLFVVFWFVRQINCEMNIKREIEASVINHLLALSLCQCHYKHAHTHTHTGTENAYTCVFISETTHVFMMCPMEEQWDKTRCTMQLQKCHINGMQL